MLTGALAVATTALTGCGVRLEDDAPDLPFVPRREPIPAEQALLAVLGALEAGGEGLGVGTGIGRGLGVAAGGGGLGVAAAEPPPPPPQAASASSMGQA